MPSPHPRPRRRKRKFETETDGNAQHDNDPGYRKESLRNGTTGGAGESPAQKRTRRGSHSGEDDDGSSHWRNINNDQYDEENRSRGLSNNGHGASSNGMPAARAPPAVAVALSRSLPPTQRPYDNNKGTYNSRRQGLESAAHAEEKAYGVAIDQCDGKRSSVSQHPRRLAQDIMQHSECWDRQHAEHAGNTACDQRILFYNKTSHSVTLKEDDSVIHNHAIACDGERTKMKILLFSVVYIITLVFAFAAIIYTQNFDHSLAILQRDAQVSLSTQKQLDVIRREMKKHGQTLLVLEKVHGHLEELKERTLQLRGELSYALKTQREQILEYKTILQQHDIELTEALERIKIFRSESEQSHSAIDLAWLRMDELMEENTELSNALRVARARIDLCDKERIHMTESLTHRLRLVIHEKDGLIDRYERLLDHSRIMDSEYQLLKHNHNELSGAFFAPTLMYVKNIQQKSDKQHSIILELRSLVHSLSSSLEINQEHLEMQTHGSIQAVDAITAATNEFSLAKKQHYEMQLERLEDEAMGAVEAVAEAAGKLEYDRKLEEQMRWQSYVAEVETILGAIRDDTVKHDGRSMKEENVVKGIDIGKTSTLMSGISRRIEEGIASLRSYIHPYKYSKESDNDENDTGVQQQLLCE